MTMPAMLYSDLAGLDRHTRILVCGPQRSGTQITARIICSKIGYQFWGHTDCQATARGLCRFLDTPRVVWHNPSMTAHVPLLRGGPDLGIVFVWRDLDDIHASQRRIGWAGRGKELRRLCRLDLEACPARIKQRLWRVWHQTMRGTYTIRYTDLRRDPLWVPKEYRQGWSSSRWQPKEEEGETP